MGSYGNQWSYCGQKWAKSTKIRKFDELSAGFVPINQPATTYSGEFVCYFPMISQNNSFHHQFSAITAQKYPLKAKLWYNQSKEFGGEL